MLMGNDGLALGALLELLKLGETPVPAATEVALEVVVRKSTGAPPAGALRRVRRP